MLMFRSRRNGLAKRLWRARISGNEEGREVIKRLLKRLNDDQLEMLAEAVECRGGDATGCIQLDQPAEWDSPQLVACQVWRWPDLTTCRELKRLPICRSATSVCCNPYHWSRLLQLEAPPPPYCRSSCERLKPEDRAPSESSQPELRGSLSTNGEGDSEACGQWCRLAYWELSQRIGRQYPVENNFVNVFGSLPRGDGLSLATLAMQKTPNPDVLKAREKIGRGVTLSKEDDGVWAYNMSDNPVFVNSPALDDPDSSFCIVYKVPPGYCLNVFTETARCKPWTTISRPHIGPIDPFSIRISFTKGWGPKYTRQEVTSCPTWLEILLAPCR
ncbi:mothers against decapentaplegic homolog 6 [Cimex lectularius]|uniref:Mothers against decapentaplegic homolog n=1 Tax=Cimex lectularius TaxID=79782 RepID=A0A8I6TF41_CIMLE|nr:mothers against decapentaplegic homolog 6 [Cimex lectularius]